MATWIALLGDLEGTQTYGELTQLNDRQLTLPFMQIPTFTATLPLRHQLADRILSEATMVRVYRDRTLVFNGQVVTAEEKGEAGGQTVQFTASGPLWRLSKRYIPDSIGAEGQAYTGDLGSIAHQILIETNDVQFTGIDVGTHVASVTGSVGPWYLKGAAEAIAEISAVLGSFEWEVEPVEPTVFGGAVGGWPRVANLNVAPAIGQSRPDVVFEYGAGANANVASYSRTIDRTNMLTFGFISVPGWPETPPEGEWLTFGMRSAQISQEGYYEDVVPDGGTVNGAIRQSILDYHLDIRQYPTQRINFKPAVNASFKPFVHYKNGDTIRARAEVNGVARFDANFRIYGMTINLDSMGNEDVDLSLVLS